MRKTVRLEVEGTLDDSLEERVIAAARKRFTKPGQTAVPKDESEDRERVAEVLIPEAPQGSCECSGEGDWRLMESIGLRPLESLP